ncbi:proteinase-activated receptor 1-like [Heptranchias perlo]|uniref:proteinase-activated receptor 1-like n=1 Tax=Heptranchias perlo TaxID=212740 RepID=UPI003559A5EC
MAFTYQLLIVSLVWTSLLTDNQTGYEDSYDTSREGLTAQVAIFTERLFSMKFVTVVLPSILLVICVVGVSANFLALLILFNMNKNPTVIFMTNVAMSDLLLVLELPLMIAYRFLHNSWTFGPFLCYAFVYSFFVNMHVSNLLLTVISADRYLGIVHPLSARLWRTSRYAAALCVLVWVTVIVVDSPLLSISQTFETRGTNRTMCMDITSYADGEKPYHHYMVMVVSFFLLPFCVIVFSHSSIIRHLRTSDSPGTGARKHRAIVMGAVVMAILTLSFAPTLIVFLAAVSEIVFSLPNAFHVLFVMSQWFSFFNCCLNPFIYYFACGPFRSRLRKLLCGRKFSG